MSGTGGSYTDRFGNTWVLRRRRRTGTAAVMTFTCGPFELVVSDGDAAESSRRPSNAVLKELFCDAERPITYRDQQWYVGYRTRTGQGGKIQSGLHTRFRSAGGEVRFATEMLLFRQMPVELLCAHLERARPAGRFPKGAP